MSVYETAIDKCIACLQLILEPGQFDSGRYFWAGLPRPFRFHYVLLAFLYDDHYLLPLPSQKVPMSQELEDAHPQYGLYLYTERYCD